MVFALAFDNFIAVFRPTKYRTWITIQRAKICIPINSLIALTFAILPHVNVPIDTVLKIDLHLNSALNSILLVVSYVLFYIAFQNQTKRSLDLRTGPNKHGGKLLQFQTSFAGFWLFLLSSLPCQRFCQLFLITCSCTVVHARNTRPSLLCSEFALT